MKIETGGSDRLNPTQPENAAPADRARPAGTGAAAGASAGRADQAALSDVARLLGRARAALTEIPEARPDRVNFLRAQIQSGEYRVQHEQLAGRLLRSVMYG
ncbi:MAG: flagellar biosynthesis anti-sigma factor FlgM [Chloroflexi bacterium]|nr:flagellar biosynthesis anti-sigma factor FlgM [Chloroflexota bacterium]